MKQIQVIRTPTGPLGLILQTATKLLSEGVISGTLDGDLHAADAATVKAAIMASAVCDFCSTPGATHYFDVPDFGMSELPNNYGAGKSTGGWMACDTCDEMVRTNKRTQLVNRAVENMAFPKFTRRAIEELYAKFWHGMDERAEAQEMAQAVVMFVENRLPEGIKPTITARDKRIEAMTRMIGLTPPEIEQAVAEAPLSRAAVAKLVHWRRLFGGETDARSLIDRLADTGPQKPLASIVPHWQRALDMKFAAIGVLTRALKATTRLEFFGTATDLANSAQVAEIARLDRLHTEMEDMGFSEDLTYLRAAETYSFNADTAAAIREAAKSIPHDAPLSSIDTPNTGAGWFYFSEPLPVVSSPDASAYTQALLWAWTDHYSAPAIAFSAYVIDEHGGGAIGPATKWLWPLSLSLHELLVLVRTKWEEGYGPGGPYEKTAHVRGVEVTLSCVSELSLFFLMACLWFKQTVPILTKEPGHIERHARKRYMRDHALTEPPTVKVVALRKTARVPAGGVEPEHRDGGRQYHCRWIVKGHPRLQACGPGRKDRKLIWIETHPAGPDDQPLRIHEKVFAVVR